MICCPCAQASLDREHDGVDVVRLRATGSVLPHKRGPANM